MNSAAILSFLLIVAYVRPSSAFSTPRASGTRSYVTGSSPQTSHAVPPKSGYADDETVVEEYRNPVTGILSNFMRKTDRDLADPLGNIDFDAPKFDRKVTLATLARILDAEL